MKGAGQRAKVFGEAHRSLRAAKAAGAGRPAIDKILAEAKKRGAPTWEDHWGYREMLAQLQDLANK